MIPIASTSTGIHQLIKTVTLSSFNLSRYQFNIECDLTDLVGSGKPIDLII